LNSVAFKKSSDESADPSPGIVSVCVPTYNGVPMLADAIQSILAQTYPVLDIWIVDNCSTDDTEQIVRRFMAEDPRVQYVRQKVNVGMSGNFNSCIELARGELMLILCSDDVLEPSCLAALARALAAHPSSALAACGRTFVDGNLKPLRIVRARPRLDVVDGSQVLNECVARGNYIGEPSAVMFRRHTASRGFNADYSQFLDLEMWLHLVAGSSLVFLPEPLCRVRRHRNQVSKANFRSGRLVEEKRHFFTRELRHRSRSISIWAKVRWDVRLIGSIARVRLHGGHVDGRAITEVFYRPVFRALLIFLNATWPLIRLWVTRSERVLA
jgi:glycosyltransferase involved in cell wall biosynthesis